MKPLRTLVAKNAASNVVRGLATACVALVLPHFLTHALGTDRFAAWSLILQIASYVSFLDFGLQTAIARFLAHTMGTDQQQRRNALVSTAISLLTIAGSMAFVLIAGLLWQAAHLFPGIPPALFPEFRSAALLLALGTCLLLPLSTYTGVLLGLHRNEFPALCIGSARIVGAIAVILAVRHTQSLVVLAACLSLANLAGGLAQVFAVRRLLPLLRVQVRAFERNTAAELARYCLGLSVWALSMLLVSGLDVTIVGHFQFSAVGIYAVAATLSLFFAGLNQSVVSALMTPIARLQAAGRIHEISSIVLRMTRLNAVCNLLLTSATLLGGPWLLHLWVGTAYAQKAYPLLCLLILAQTVRLTLNPYAVALVAVGQQTQALLPAIAEASVNLAASLLGMYWFGAVGVAAGTLLGACAGVLMMMLYSVPRLEGELAIRRRELMQEGLSHPLRVLGPLLACCVLALVLHRATAGLGCAGLLLSGWLAYWKKHAGRTPLQTRGSASVLS